MKSVATSVVEVRDQRVRNYMGDYDAYVYAIEQEIEAGERAQGQGKRGGKPAKTGNTTNDSRIAEKELRKLRKSANKLEAKSPSLMTRRKCWSKHFTRVRSK